MTIFSSLTGRLLDQELGTDDSTVLFTTARRNAAINDGQREFAVLTKCLERRSSITITGGTAEYDLNSTSVFPNGDFLEWATTPLEVRYTNASSDVTVLAGGDLPRLDPLWLHRHEPGWQISTVNSSVQQLPSGWYERIDGPQRLVGFQPTPSTGSSASLEAFLTYIAYPTPMSSASDTPFTVNSSARTDLRRYHQALVHYGASQLEKLRRDEAASDRQLQKFLGYVSQYLQDMRRKGGTHLTMARNYFRYRRDAYGDRRDIRT